MKSFMLGVLVSSLLGTGLVWAQQVLTDPYGQVQGYLYGTPPPMSQDWLGPSRITGQELSSILQQRNPCR